MAAAAENGGLGAEPNEARIGGRTSKTMGKYPRVASPPFGPPLCSCPAASL